MEQETEVRWSVVKIALVIQALNRYHNPPPLLESKSSSVWNQHMECLALFTDHYLPQDCVGDTEQCTYSTTWSHSVGRDCLLKYLSICP